ncbi:hypothetical protein ADK54_25240 [Streptomyces sp. WM6378]|nr:hypothetical protein ADK54_25240 [Streptomyces sp. WM6378]
MVQDCPEVRGKGEVALPEAHIGSQLPAALVAYGQDGERVAEIAVRAAAAEPCHAVRHGE